MFATHNNIRDKDLSQTDINVFALSILFIINPIIGIIMSIITIVVTSKIYGKYFICLGVFLSMWIGLINMTKTPDSDFENYVQYFYSIPTFSLEKIIEYGADGSGKEFIYALINYIGYYVVLGKASSFFFLITVLIYGFVFKAIYDFMIINKVSKTVLLCSFLLLAFFDQFFGFSAHLVRQMLASSIAIYCVVYHLKNKKNCWLLMFIAVFIHTSAALLIIISIIPYIYKRIPLWLLILSLILVICLMSFIYLLSNIAVYLGALEYGVNRLAKGGSDGTEGFSPMIMYVVLFPAILISIIQLIRIRYQVRSSLYPIFYCFLFIATFVLSFTQSPLIQYRFFFYVYVFLPFILPLFLFNINNRLNKFYNVSITIIFILRFFMHYNNGSWHYCSLVDLFFCPLPYYFISTPIY